MADEEEDDEGEEEEEEEEAEGRLEEWTRAGVVLLEVELGAVMAMETAETPAVGGEAIALAPLTTVSDSSIRRSAGNVTALGLTSMALGRGPSEQEAMRAAREVHGKLWWTLRWQGSERERQNGQERGRQIQRHHRR